MIAYQKRVRSFSVVPFGPEFDKFVALELNWV